MKRKSVTVLNNLRKDIESLIEEMTETARDLQHSAEDIGTLPVHDLVTHDLDWKANYDDLNKSHLHMAKLLKRFRKARAMYIDFF